MKFAVIDFETTGNQPSDEIIQAGLVVVENNEIISRYTSLVKPGTRIPDFICELTGITDEMVKDAPSVEQVMAEMQPYLEDAILVGHHIPFDLGFLQRALDISGYRPFNGRVLDTLELLRILFPSLGSLSLSMVTQSLGIPHVRPHQADSDAEATGLLWIRILERIEELDLLTVQRIAYLFEVETTDLSWFLQELRSWKESTLAEDPDASRYFRQFALNVEDWSDEKPPREGAGTEWIDKPFDEFYEAFTARMQERFPGYEARPAQEQMIHEVQESFEEERHLMIEAGTGTGKSMAYLIPSLYYGIKEDKKVIVSTHTIQLQEQLRQRDVPLLQELFPIPFQAAVLKGRNHYLCLRKFENKVNQFDFENGREDRITAAQMVVWLSGTHYGDDEELYLTSKANDFWQDVASDADSCLNRHCPWFRKCFYHRAKNQSHMADLVITNHSLLFTDVKAENRLLPGYEHLIVDEAHHLEEVASKHLGLELHYFSMVHTLTWLYKDNKSGLLPTVTIRLQQEADGSEKAAKWLRTIHDIEEQLVEAKEHWDELAQVLYDLIGTGAADAGATEGGQLVYRVKPDSLPRSWDTLRVIEDNLYIGLGEAVKLLDRLLSDWKDVQEELGIQHLVTDLNGASKDLARHRDTLHVFMQMQNKDDVYWLEASPQFKSKSVQLMSVPVDVSGMLRQFFFDAKKSIILTSATLSVDKKFHYTCEQLGLKPEDPSGKLKTVLLPSPFQYRQQALLVVPRDFPNIKGNSGEAYFVEKLTESLREVAVSTGGRMLVLFTSYRMLKAVHQRLKEELAPSGIQVLGQGLDSGNRSKLTRMFKEHAASVLLGTSSFWEGVDIPGNALSCLAIIRLPFQPPNHPLVEAKCEVYKKNNQNPFMKYSVPQAVIRFKQGFGRLVRTATDKGIVIVYDTRVIDTAYGKHFLYSLPGPKIEHMTTAQLVPRITEWMGGEEQ
ncbi:ATP-dependent DNA helicase DinG [Gorillibacterium sp. sgz5001074]|uniref:ATP-dependent DNA helicase DinG n=1 Tax=Gorillibacterium sp. sgz5001074 TaxID=3446695 RepID=UPI003F677EFC